MSDANPVEDPYAEAKLALDRAHRCAKSLEGGELRRALEDARDALRALSALPSATALSQAAGDKIGAALGILDSGPLDEAEHLIEAARQDLSSTGPA